MPRHNTDASPASPCCPSTVLDKLANDGSTLFCKGCSRVYRADNLDPDAAHDLVSIEDIKELMQPTITVPPGGSSGRSRQRREMKPGEREWLATRRERRHEQEPLGFGSRDSGRMRRAYHVKVDDDLASDLEAYRQVTGLSPAEMFREGVRRLVADAAEQSRAQHPA